MNGTQEEGVSLSDVANFLSTAARVTATVIGIVLIIIGLTYTIRVIDGIYTIINEPQKAEVMVETWSGIIGEISATITAEGNVVTTNLVNNRMLAIGILAGAAALLAMLSLGLISAGARVISITSSDKEAVKKILKHAFGENMKKPENPQEQENT
jgi:hypothetical protein